MTFGLGSTSRSRLKGVHPRLVLVVEKAILLTAQDFAAHCGLRTLEKQREHVASGTSWTMDSKHLPQGDGYAHAVDLVPFVDGRLNWDWSACYEVAAAVAAAARETGTDIRWGGVWDRPLRSYGTSAAAIRKASANYVYRRQRTGKRAAIDGPHFELISSQDRRKEV